MDGKPLATTIDPDLQSLAEQVLADEPSASSIVAVRPSTGEILTAANGPGSEGLPTALLGQAPRPSLQATDDSVDSWARVMFDQLWNQRRLDRIGHYFSTDSICHAGGGRVAEGLRNQQALMLLILSAMPDAVMQVDKVTWSDETDGVIVAVRWRLEGSSQGGALLGDCPINKPVLLNGMSHLRLNGEQVVEHWMIFDEIGALVHLYRA